MITNRLLNTARKTAGTAVFLLTLTSPSLLDAQSLTGSGPGDTQSIAPQPADVGAASLRDNTPLVSADSSLMFFNSARRGYRPWATWDSVKMRYDEDIYYARRSTNPVDGKIWESPLNLGAEINTSHDDAIAAISRNGRTVYFTSLKKGWEKDGGPYYQAELAGTKWTSVKGMGEGITEFFLKRDRSLNFRVYGATISPDGKDFYFATTVGSSDGVHQIWLSRLVDERWSYPVKLGPEVNRGEGSYAPQIGEDGKTLFFASHQKSGKGELIMASVATDNGWQPAIVLGILSDTVSLNAPVPALSDPARVSALATSSGSISDATLRSAAPEVQRLSRVVLVKVRIADRLTGRPVGGKISIEDLSAGRMVYDASASQNGEYTAVLQPGRDYGISVNAPGYVFLSERYTIPENASFKEMERLFEVEKLTAGRSFTVNNIFFGYNVDSLDDASRLDLDRLIGLMKQTDGLMIEIGGHTDNIGSAAFNRELSLARAEAVRRYMIEKGGIGEARIHARGYGFGKPAAANSSEEGRSLNRRTEVKVLQIGG